MSETDIRKIVQEELGNIAPEVDLATIDPAADLREAIDIDSISTRSISLISSRPCTGGSASKFRRSTIPSLLPCPVWWLISKPG